MRVELFLACTISFLPVVSDAIPSQIDAEVTDLRVGGLRDDILLAPIGTTRAAATQILVLILTKYSDETATHQLISLRLGIFAYGR
jgi:hypothetical protein